MEFYFQEDRFTLSLNEDDFVLVDKRVYDIAIEYVRKSLNFHKQYFFYKDTENSYWLETIDAADSKIKVAIFANLYKYYGWRAGRGQYSYYVHKLIIEKYLHRIEI